MISNDRSVGSAAAGVPWTCRLHMERRASVLARATGTVCSAVLLATLASTGCVRGAEEQEPDVSGDMPNIYVDIREEAIQEGSNPYKAGYRQMLEACRKAKFPTRALSPEQVQKIATSRRQNWYSPDFSAARHESWEYGVEKNAPPGACFFELVHTGEHSYTDGTTLVRTDLATGETIREPAAPDALFRIALSGDTGRTADRQGPVKRSIAGQQCLEWTSLRDSAGLKTRVCLWSEGRPWGFAAHPSVSSYCGDSTRDHAIVLSEEPLSGTGCRSRVQSMTVGQPLDPSAYLPPEMGGSSP